LDKDVPNSSRPDWPWPRPALSECSCSFPFLLAVRFIIGTSLGQQVLSCCCQVVVNALIQAIPAIFNVLLVCLVFWLIFSIIGVSLFGGRFSSCVDSSGEMVNSSEVGNKSTCLELQHLNYTWFTPDVKFNDVFQAYLALLQVVAFDFISVALCFN